jgi:hypothetical protein
VSSVFGGWTGDVCINQLTGNCVFTMDSAKTVLASFDLQHKFKIYGRGLYSASDNENLQYIYNQSLNGETIMAISGISSAYDFLGGYSAMNADKGSNTNIIVGGYDSDYTTSSGFTTLEGRVNLKAGKVVFKNIKIKPKP